jgi:hypothetical protein
VQSGHGLDGIVDVTATTPVIAKDAPVFESCDGMFDTRSTPTMTAPGVVADDSTPFEDRCHELGHATVSTIGEYPTVPSA